jgi:hypothetical protein
MMEIFKLIYEHDLRLDNLRERKLDRGSPEVSASIEDFLKPDPTYSKFYLSGTMLNDEKFGLSCLKSHLSVLEQIQNAFEGINIFNGTKTFDLISDLDSLPVGRPLIVTKKEQNQWQHEELKLEADSNAGHKKEGLANVLSDGDMVLYKEPAHDGYDLHLFSQKNIYRDFFYRFQKMVNPEFRFFSMNGRRVRSERRFYFETWTLERPPHGVEEVFKETVL